MGAGVAVGVGARLPWGTALAVGTGLAAGVVGLDPASLGPADGGLPVGAAAGVEAVGGAPVADSTPPSGRGQNATTARITTDTPAAAVSIPAGTRI